MYIVYSHVRASRAVDFALRALMILLSRLEANYIRACGRRGVAFATLLERGGRLRERDGWLRFRLRDFRSEMIARENRERDSSRLAVIDLRLRGR